MDLFGDEKLMELKFIKGHRILNVYIKDRTINFLVSGMNQQPLPFDLNVIENMPEHEQAIYFKNFEFKIQEILPSFNLGLNSVNKYKTDALIAKDIIKDLQEDGWRRYGHRN